MRGWEGFRLKTAKPTIDSCLGWLSNVIGWSSWCSEGGGEVQDDITQLRRDLMKSQGEAKLWKEEAERIQMEYINFQSRSSDNAIAGAELDASRLKLEHAQGKLGE